MAEITDRPDYRIGQPRTFPVHYLPFYDWSNPEASTSALRVLREILRRDGDHISTIIVELVQGEAGFVTAPRDFFVPLFEECKRAGILVWVDEIQTFGRTGELFATSKLNLAEYVDLITIGKILQGSAMLHRHELTPDPSLISGTFSGATVAMAVGRRIIEKLTGEGFFGPQGRVAELERLTREHLERLARKHLSMISHVDGVGAMIAFRLSNGSLDQTRAFIGRCFDEGLALYYGGHQTACIRLFLPAGCLVADELAEAFAIMDRCIESA
jgi:4-aminobutyrate aminotransferase-like enzyme